MQRFFLLSVFVLSGAALFLWSPVSRADSETTISGVTPNVVGVGTLITIEGTNFGTDCEYEAGGYSNECQMSVIFSGGKEVRFSDGDDNDREWTGTAIAVLVPSGAESGALKVHYAYQNNTPQDKTDDVNYDLTGPELTVVSADAAPTISNITPQTVLVGDTITIQGKNLREDCEKGTLECQQTVTVGGEVVNFQLGTDTNAVSWTAEQIVVKVPVNATSGSVVVYRNAIENFGTDDATAETIQTSWDETLKIVSNRVTADRAEELRSIQQEADAFAPASKGETSFENIASALGLTLSRDLDKEAEAEKLLDRIFGDFDSSNHLGGAATEYSFIFYVAYDVGSTAQLGAGERVGVLNSWRSAYDVDYPSNGFGWQSLLKVANGRWPNTQSLIAESEAGVRFQQIYKRSANRSNPNDDAAVMTMAYGLRPEPRKLTSEWNAVVIFKGIFGYSPTSAIDWDAVRAIAYSGATR